MPKTRYHNSVKRDEPSKHPPNGNYLYLARLITPHISSF